VTSKLRRTIVGVGIALGGAAPGCFGRTDVAELAPLEGSDEPTATDTPDDRTPDATPTDAGRPSRVDAGNDSGSNEPPTADAGPSDGGPPDAAPPDAAPNLDAGMTDAASDAAVDASNDAADPFCDVAWPPTKGLPDPRSAPCVDPLNECKGNAYVPRGCFRLLAPDVCSYERTWEGPLYCIDGEWRCPPGTEDGPRCVCFGPLGEGQTCTDAGISGP
jgi:hypothetical protein